MIDKTVIDPNALHFYRMLKEAGFSAYFVGGSVRDLLLGKRPKDFDIATNATPQQIKRVIPQGRIIGRRFRHVMLERSGGRYEIVTFRGPVVHPEDTAELDDEALEDQPMEGEAAAQPTGNSNEGRQRRYPDLNQFGNAEQDAKRRDFTINALFYDPDADELVDYVEGKLDIDRKLIRSIGDPMVRMEEDPIRILRAIRHKMKLGLDYDPALEHAMREKAPLLLETSKDRIREEFLKVCNDRSLGDFLSENRRLGLTPYVMPWFEDISEERWEAGLNLWTKFAASAGEKGGPDMGLALMLVPLIEPLVLEPYQASVSEGEKNYLPDMKYFLSCEKLRDYYLRNLRISRAQTDYLVRALFYFSRMSGLWLEQGPPRRIIGKLFQHPPALLAAQMTTLALIDTEQEVPDWLKELAEHDRSRGRQRGSRSEQSNRRDDRERSRSDSNERERRSASEDSEGREVKSEREETPRPQRLPPPDQPMVWNGPLHAPVLRPVFPDEPTIRWARKNQTVRAYRPSGIPNSPTDYSLLKSSLVYNYKPEIDTQARSEEERSERGKGRRGGRDRKRGRDKDRQAKQSEQEEVEMTNSNDGENQNSGPGEPQQQIRGRAAYDEDSIGNIRMPGELPAALSNINGSYNEDEVDDDIGNRLDSPPTSGHIGVNGAGFQGNNANGQQRRGSNNSRRGGGGGGSGGRRRGGRRRGRRGGGGGQARGSSSRSSHDNS